MCNACGFYCCASDEFEKCGCEGCYCSACWPGEEDDDYDDDLGMEYEEPYSAPKVKTA